jgi:putative transposase
MLKTALRTEADDYVECHGGACDAAGRALVVRNGQAKARKLTLGTTTVELRASRVNNRRCGHEWRRHRLISSILPPTCAARPR